MPEGRTRSASTGRWRLHRGALLVGDSAAGVLNERLERFPGGGSNDHLDRRAHVDEALRHARDAVRPRRRPVLFELDALRSDDDLSRPSFGMRLTLRWPLK